MINSMLPDGLVFRGDRRAARIAGAMHYITGSMCRRGHRSVRLVSTGGCCQCRSKTTAEFYRANRSKRIAYAVAHRRANIAKYRATNRAWSQRESVKIHRRERERRDRTKPNHNINNRMAAAIWRSLRSGKAGRHWHALVGYSPQELMRHLERQFKRGMSWRNMGRWHVDHIIPLSKFSFVSESDPAFKAAWALTNLRPLWKAENIRKHDRVETLL
jgi:hypothetical protein